MSLGTQLGPMGNSLQDNNDKVSLGTKFAPMLDTLREIQSEFKTNGATNYSSSTISKTVTPTGTQEFSRQTNIKNGIGKEKTVKTSLNAQGQGKQCTEQKTLKDGKITDTSQSCQKVQKKNPLGQQQSPTTQDKNQIGQQQYPTTQDKNQTGQQQNLQQAHLIGQQTNPPGQQVDPIEQKQKRKIQAQNQKKTNITSQDDDFFSLPQ